MRRLVPAVLVFLILLLVLIQFMLPTAASMALTHAARGAVGAEGQVKIRVAAFPAVKILFGQFDRLDVTMENVTPGGLPISRLSTTITNVRLDLGQLLASREIAVQLSEPGAIEVALTGGDLTALLRQRLEGLKEPKVTLAAGEAVISGRVSLIGAEIPLAMSGRFAAGEPGEILFIPEKLQASGISLPSTLEKRLLSRFQFRISLAGLPFLLEIGRITVDEDRLTITGTTKGRV